MKHIPQRSDAGDDLAAFEDQVFRALVQSGAIIPEALNEVEETERRLARERSSLPAHLQDSRAILERLRDPKPGLADKIVPMPSNEFAEAKEELKRAARNGQKYVSAEVEARLRLNRERVRAEHGGRT